MKPDALNEDLKELLAPKKGFCEVLVDEAKSPEVRKEPDEEYVLSPKLVVFDLANVEPDAPDALADLEFTPATSPGLFTP